MSVNWLDINIGCHALAGNYSWWLIQWKTKDEHAIEDIATYVGEASIDCVQTKYGSKDSVMKCLANGDINTSRNQ